MYSYLSRIEEGNYTCRESLRHTRFFFFFCCIVYQPDIDHRLSRLQCIQALQLIFTFIISIQLSFLSFFTCQKNFLSPVLHLPTLRFFALVRLNPIIFFFVRCLPKFSHRFFSGHHKPSNKNC